MLVLLILIVVLLAIAPRVIQGRPRLLNCILLVLCVLALVLSAANYAQRQRARLRSTVSDAMFDRHWMVGWHLGEKLCADFPEGGRVVVLQSPNDSQGWSTMVDFQLDGFRSALGESAFEVERYRPGSRPPGTPRMDGEPEPIEMGDCLAKTADADAIVSFVTMPLGDDPSMLPPVYLLDSFGSGYWRTAMSSGLVQAVVAPRMQLSRERRPERKATANDRFSAIYLVITPNNIADFKTPMEQFREAHEGTTSP